MTIAKKIKIFPNIRIIMIFPSILSTQLLSTKKLLTTTKKLKIFRVIFPKRKSLQKLFIQKMINNHNKRTWKRKFNPYSPAF